jgi:O-antigen/teichoic acid export membrane protein
MIKIKNISTGLKKIAKNATWIILERVIRLLIGLAVGIWIARYLGPFQYGMFSFGLAWVGLFSVLSNLGLEGILVRDLVAGKNSANTTLGTAVMLRLLGSVVCVGSAIGGYLLFYGPDNRDQIVIIALVSMSQVFLATEVIDYWFRSRVEWKYVFRARMAAIFFSTTAKIIFLLTGASVIWIASVVLLDAVLIAIFLLVELARDKNKLGRWRARLCIARQMLSDCWPNILAGIAVVVYMRMDMIMIGSMMTAAEVGVYSVAVRISQIWYVIPLAITQSITPSIVSSRKVSKENYERKMIVLISSLFWASVTVAILMTILSPSIITILFGEEYESAGDVLRIHFWSGVFVAIGLAINQWFLAENLLKINLIRTISGAIINLLLNFILIPKMGIIGAAIATVVSQFFSTYFSSWWFRTSKPAFRLLNRGIVYPFKRKQL